MAAKASQGERLVHIHTTLLHIGGRLRRSSMPLLSHPLLGSLGRYGWVGRIGWIGRDGRVDG